MSTSPELMRSVLIEKVEYSVRSRVGPEWFIVPLLKRHIESAVREFASPRAGARVLDVGCGGQPFRTFLESLGYTYTGIDVQQNPAGTVATLCAIDRPLPVGLTLLGQFDFLFCTEVLEHVLHWNQAFINFTELLTPGGVLLVTCPHFYPPHEEPYDFWRPTALGVEQFARAAGLEVIQITRAGSPWDVLGTFLGVSGIVPATPGLLSRMVTFPFWIARKALIWLNGQEAFRRHVRLTGPMYLSTIAVLRRPEQAAT